MLQKIYLLFIISVLSLLVSCSGGSSSNGNSNDSSNNQFDTSSEVNSSTECSDGFGDASRCETRDRL